MDQEQPFNPQDVERQVDQLSSSERGTYGISHPDQRFLSDLRLVLSAEDGENQPQENARSLQRAWARIEAIGRAQHTIQREQSRTKNRRIISMATLPSMPDTGSISRRKKFIRGLSTLVAVAVALVVVGTAIMFAMVSRHQQVNQPQATSVTGASPKATSSQVVNDYVYHQQGMPVYNVQWSLDGRRIISENENAYGWDAFTGAHEIKYVGSSAEIPQLLFSQVSPDGKTLAIGNVGQIDLYEAATGKHLSSLTYPFTQAVGAKFDQPHFGPYIGWSPDGKFVRGVVQIPAADGQSIVNKLVTYTVATGARQELLLSFSEQLGQEAWSPNGEYVAVGRPASGIVSVLRVATGEIVSNLHAGPPIEDLPLGWSPDSHKLAANFDDSNSVYIWNAEVADPGTVIYRGGTQPTWSPNGKYIAVISDKTVKVLDAATGKLLHMYDSKAGNVYALAWSPNSHVLAAGGASADGRKGIVNVWKVAF